MPFLWKQPLKDADSNEGRSLFSDKKLPSLYHDIYSEHRAKKKRKGSGGKARDKEDINPKESEGGLAGNESAPCLIDSLWEYVKKTLTASSFIQMAAQLKIEILFLHERCPS